MKKKKTARMVGSSTILFLLLFLGKINPIPLHTYINNFIREKPAYVFNSAIGGLSQQEYTHLAKLSYRRESSNDYITVNNNKSTLIPSSWKINHIKYANLDNLNRTSRSTTAFLEKRNVTNTTLRKRQYFEPTGWHYNRYNVDVYNRGHLIAYSISRGINSQGVYSKSKKTGDQNNPKNLFTQTAYANQKIQTIFESKVRTALLSGKKVIYQATPIFRQNELMARGINLQAISTDKELNFNVYVYNIQPHFTFDYQSGRASKSIFTNNTWSGQKK